METVYRGVDLNGCVRIRDMPTSPLELAGVVLAAGLGTRLRPLTDLRPKALCRGCRQALADHAWSGSPRTVGLLSVNAHHHEDQVRAHLAGRDIHISPEELPRGSGGALALLRPWDR